MHLITPKPTSQPSYTDAGRISPVDTVGPRVPLYTHEFATDPHRIYREMRSQFGSLVPVYLAPDVPATLVIGYQHAVRILNDPERFPADPRTWQEGVPADCPILPMLEWRPNALRSAGVEHTRYRQAIAASIAEIDLHTLRSSVERITVALINNFCTAGAADLLAEYAFPLAFDVLNVLLGCPPELGQRVATGLAAIFDGIEAEKGNIILAEALHELVTLKRVEPGDDVTTRLLQHPAGLDDTEMVHQLVILYGGGIEPPQNLIANTLLVILTDERFAGNVIGGAQSTRDALDEVLFSDPPMANHCITYPRQPILLDGVWLPAHQPVVISMSGCNNDPAISAGEYAGNRSHLAWSIGPHACPARSAAYVIVQEAIDQLLDALPELSLAMPADELTWRPGPFHRALTALPVAFPKSPPLHTF
ncbi:cytochrome P450 [Nocardia sp. NBC_00508]|uniref:cytochrome P450 n=1 Tax=Nocardia sp. NBC_00508 TaxID=2975992 RepID=UPI002E8097FF|nr:cytochrome P450 [Nocardia sp. NBC_00508]WUD67967.1 cytochrome P450 [Nocardia sp. NBC_00508]